MPNILDANGLQVASRSELITFYTAQFMAIYGADINLDPDTPDGQMLNIFVQSILDMEDLLVQIYNAFDPDNAIGVVLDQRVAINGVQRQEGTFTITNVTITTDRALTLYGLDQSIQPVYTVADNAGNQWLLIATQVVPSSGVYVYAFRAANPGANLTIPNTITVPVTIVLGVTAINNPTTFTTLGFNEESDQALKIRRLKSVSQGATSYLGSLLAVLENTVGVTYAAIFENVTGSVDADGIPGHGIWVIVAGTAANKDIATAIYKKRSTGANMKGSISYFVTQPDGTLFKILWDTVQAENLFIQFFVSPLDAVTPPNIAAIRAGLVTKFAPGVNQQVNINDLATIVQELDPNTLVTNAGFNTAATGVFSPALSPTAKNQQFAVSSPNIIITPMQILPNLTSIHVSGVQQFTQLGGYGAMTWAPVSMPSGGNITSGGLYTAGTTPNVTDSFMVTDALGNTANAIIQVIP